MKVAFLKIIIFLLLPVMAFSYINGSDFTYYMINYEYGAINASTSGTFSTTSYTNFAVDHNPALIVLGERVSYNNSSFNLDIIVPVSVNYNSFIFRRKNYATGLSHFYSDENNTFITSSYSISLSSHISKNITGGINLKYIHGKFGNHTADNLCAGLGIFSFNHLKKLTYKKTDFFSYCTFMNKYLNNYSPILDQSEGISFGVTLRNLGPDVVIIDYYDGDPLPQKLNLGISYTPVISNIISVKVGYEFEKDLIATYPNRDIDGNGEIGGYDRNGNIDHAGFYSKNGKYEIAHHDKWYKSLFTSWVDDWLLQYDSAADGIGLEDEDNDLKDGSFEKELNTIINHLGVDISLLGWFGLQYGIMKDGRGDSHVKSSGYYFGPDYLRYYYAKSHQFGNRYIENTIEFHTIEFNYTTNFSNIIQQIIK